MKLWDKGFSIDKQIEKFTVGNDREIDMHIAKYDVQASLAHAIMLASIGIITTDELNDLKRGLQELSNDIENGTFTIEASFEDVHSKIEWELTNKLGEVGKKIHTARSRNDQVLVALQLYYKENLSIINDQTKRLFDTLLSLADSHKESLLPGYTHLQVAMPSSFWIVVFCLCRITN
jgi:argininosuccinate lyase